MIDALNALAANELYEWLVLAQDAREDAYEAGDVEAELAANEQCEALVAEALRRELADV